MKVSKRANGIAIIIIMFAATSGLAQTTDLYEKQSGFRYGYAYNRLNDFQLGYGRVRRRELSLIGAYRSNSYFINLGYGTDFSKNVMTSKITYELVEVLVAARLNLVNYTDLKHNQTFLLPEVGVTFGGLISLMYGYRVNLSSNKFNVSRGSVSLTLTPF